MACATSSSCCMGGDHTGDHTAAKLQSPTHSQWTVKAREWQLEHNTDAYWLIRSIQSIGYSDWSRVSWSKWARTEVLKFIHMWINTERDSLHETKTSLSSSLFFPVLSFHFSCPIRRHPPSPVGHFLCLSSLYHPPPLRYHNPRQPSTPLPLLWLCLLLIFVPLGASQ